MSVNQEPYNGKQDTHSEYESEAFRKAKNANGIPNSRDPINTGQPQKIPDRNNPGKFVYQYEFDNDYNEKISIRLDNATEYKESDGNQGPHYNAGIQGTKLKQHHYFKKYNR